MPTVYPLHYSPNIDSMWSVNPGACTAMAKLVQRQDGMLHTFVSDYQAQSSSFGFSLTGSDHLHAEVFAQTDATSRFLTFRKQDIDEYSSAGVRTNRGTGYNAATTAWSAAAWGNQIIACNYLDATQSSTGAGFSGLGGSAPKARYVASNINFVMLADVDDGGSNVHSDMVWWCGLRNPATWVPNPATQAGAIRLLDIPGPIKQIVAFGDRFVAFKDAGVFVGSYIGPPYVFSWRVVVAGIGLSYPKAVTECDGKLYFVHTSGVYSFDGQGVQNVGRPAWPPTESWGTGDTIRMRGDDIQGNVYLCVHEQVVGSFTQNLMYSYAYNARTGLWARQGLVSSSDSAANNPEQPVVYGTTAEYRAFIAGWGVVTGFAWIDNASSCRLSFAGSGASSLDSPLFTTGLIGTNEGSTAVTQAHLRTPGTGLAANKISSATLSGYHNEAITTPDTTATLTWNTETVTLDGVISAPYKTLTVNFTTANNFKLAGVGFNNYQAGRR